MMQPYIRAQLQRSAEVVAALRSDEVLLDCLARSAELCVQALGQGKKIIFAGNGGSAADAQHLAGELVSRFGYDRPGLAAVALTTDTSVLTAISNDYGYEQVFARQIQALGQPGDMFIAISTSGRSKNILAALRAAKERGLITLGMTGVDGGGMSEFSDHLIMVPARETPKIQEGHITLGHILCGLIEAACFPRSVDS